MTDTVAIDTLKAQLAILNHVREKKAELAEMEAAARAAIETALGDAEIGTIDGRPAVSYKYVRRQSVDQKLLKQKYPEIAEQCLTVTESRRFTITGGEQ